MLTWLSDNLATIVVAAILLAIVVLIIVKMVRDRRNGKNSCGCGCESCPSRGVCHKG